MARASRLKYSKLSVDGTLEMYMLVGQSFMSSRLWIAIYGFADSKTGQCYPRHKLLMRNAYIPDRHNFYKALKHLQQLGLLKIIKTGRGCNTYEIPQRYLIGDTKSASEDAPNGPFL